jgi:hypothetical protein
MSLHDFLLRAKAILHGSKVEEELDEELQSHLELQTRKHLDGGLSFEQAKRQARIDFGVVELAKDNCRDERRVNVVDDLLQDLRYAFRGFRRDPMLASVAPLTLASCIGANTTVFSLVNTIILRPLPYPNSDRLYWLSERAGEAKTNSAPVRTITACARRTKSLRTWRRIRHGRSTGPAWRNPSS